MKQTPQVGKLPTKKTGLGFPLFRLRLAGTCLLLIFCGMSHQAVAETEPARPPMEIIVGGDVLDAAQALPHLKLFKEMGATSAELHHLEHVEKSSA